MQREIRNVALLTVSVRDISSLLVSDGVRTWDHRAEKEREKGDLTHILNTNGIIMAAVTGFIVSPGNC